MGVILFPSDVTLDEKTEECVGKNITATRELLLKYDIRGHVLCVPPSKLIRMIENAEVDFTISIKSNEAMTKHVVFSDIPFRKVILNIYTHNQSNQRKIISAVRGFDYQGQRQKISQKGFEFINFPNTISAIPVFLKGRSDYMLSYESPVQNYLLTNNITTKVSDSITPLLEIGTYYGIAKGSVRQEAYAGY